MLSSACRSFRLRFEPWPATPSAADADHRRHCSRCDRWAASVETAARAGIDRPLPAALVERLRRLGGPSAAPPRELPGDLADRLARLARPPVSTEEGTAAPEAVVAPLPHLPLPPALALRLRAIARSPSRRPAAPPRRPPRWVQSPLPALAASLLVAVALASAVGNPVTAPVAVEIGAGGSALLKEVGDLPANVLIEASASARRHYDAAVAAASASWSRWSDSLEAGAPKLRHAVRDLPRRTPSTT